MRFKKYVYKPLTDKDIKCGLKRAKKVCKIIRKYDEHIDHILKYHTFRIRRFD